LGVKSVNGFNGINGSVKKLDTLLIKRLLSYMFDFPLPEKDRESKVCDMLINAVKDSEINGYYQNSYTNNELFI
jgi:hypothetical protein